MRLILLFLPLVLFSWTPEQKIALQDIAQQFGIEENLADGAQRLWYQGAKERWQFDSRYEEMRDQLWPLFEQLGLVNAIEPQQAEYDHLLIFGALLPTVEFRLKTACELWERGIRFRQIVLLSGERPLLPSEIERMQSTAESEAQMMQWLYDHSSLPAGMKNIPVILIDAPAQSRPHRPTTTDTMNVWLATHPQPGHCLAISNQPYVIYQQTVAQKLLPPDFTLETVGRAIHPSVKVSLILDTLAKTLYAME